MAEKTTKSAAEFRREVAMAFASAYIVRHGGFASTERAVLMRTCWDYADCFIAQENEGPLPPTVETPLPDLTAPRRRKAHPSDEFAVRDGSNLKRGFVTIEDAEFYASARPQATVFQLSGPEKLVAQPDAV